jgi:hypothetical protein
VAGPINETGVSVDQAFLVELYKGFSDSFAILIIQSECKPIPIDRNSHSSELMVNSATIFFLPLPNRVDKSLSAKIVSRLLLLLPKLLFDDRLGGNTGVVSTWQPEDFVA